MPVALKTTTTLRNTRAFALVFCANVTTIPNSSKHPAAAPRRVPGRLGYAQRRNTQTRLSRSGYEHECEACQFPVSLTVDCKARDMGGSPSYRVPLHNLTTKTRTAGKL